MPIESLSLKRIGPFEAIDFAFDPHVNVFVGPNNSGKSTALMALAHKVVHPFHFPLGLVSNLPEAWIAVRLLAGAEAITLSGPLLDLSAPPKSSTLKQLGFTCFVPALRQATGFLSKGPVAIRWKDPEDEKRELIAQPGHALVKDEHFLQKIINLDYQAYRENNPAVRRILTVLATVVSEITVGFPIKTIKVLETPAGLFPAFETPDGTFGLDTLSQGTQSVIQWVGRFALGLAEYYAFASDLLEKPAVLIVDEIDAHLHPSWQQRIIPALTRHFPNLQVFCSTHSPLMIAGMKAGQVQLLARDPTGRVSVSRNEKDIAGWTADEILRCLMDIETPTDIETAGLVDKLNGLEAMPTRTSEEQREMEDLRAKLGPRLLGPEITKVIGHMQERMKELAPASPGGSVEAKSVRAKSARYGRSPRPRPRKPE